MLHFRPLFSLVFHIVSLDFLFDHNYILLLDCINSKSVCRSTEFCFPVSFDSFLSESIWYIPCYCIFYNIALGAAVKARGQGSEWSEEDWTGLASQVESQV